MADQDTQRRLFILFCKKLLKEGEAVTTKPVAMVKISFLAKLSLEQLTSTMSSLFFFCGAKFSLSDKE